MTAFLAALTDQRNEESVIDGIGAFVHLYYSEYSDATEIEPHAMRVLLDFENLMTDVTAYVGFDLAEVIRNAERDVNSYRRPRVQTAYAWDGDS